jgi:hypothetical protein
LDKPEILKLSFKISTEPQWRRQAALPSGPFCPLSHFATFRYQDINDALTSFYLMFSTDSDFSRFPGLKWRNPLI